MATDDEECRSLLFLPTFLKGFLRNSQRLYFWIEIYKECLLCCLCNYVIVILSLMKFTAKMSAVMSCMCHAKS